ncbi:Glycine-rich domain-containing protein 2 [Bienertia sinuspersici]
MTMSHEVEGSMMYNTYWLPLLVQYLKNHISDDSLVVRLDCEWIWHCHRLNPCVAFMKEIRYKTDCEKLYGRVLSNDNIIASTQGISMSKTKETWNIMYLEEPYELDHNRKFPIVSQKSDQGAIFTDYDLVSAIRQQDYFYY